MKTQYIVNGWVKYSAEDNFEQGEIGNEHSCMGRDSFRADTLEELIAQLMIFAGTDDREALIFDSCDEIGRLDIQMHKDSRGRRASAKKLDAWKAGKLPLFNSTYTFHIQRHLIEDVSLIRELVNTH